MRKNREEKGAITDGRQKIGGEAERDPRRTETADPG